MTRPYEGSHQEYDAFIDSNFMIPHEGRSQAGHGLYTPAAGGKRAAGKFPVIWSAHPYGNTPPKTRAQSQVFCPPGVCVRHPRREGNAFSPRGEW